MKPTIFFIGDFVYMKETMDRMAGSDFEFEFFPHIDDMTFFHSSKKPAVILTECANHQNLADGKISLMCDRVTKRIKKEFPDTAVVFFGENAMLESCFCAEKSQHIDHFLEKTEDHEKVFTLIKRISQVQ